MTGTTAIRWMMAAAGLAAMPAAVCAAAPMEFVVNDVAIVVGIPDGYCAPTGANRVAADMLAQSDSQNRTPVTLVRCDRRDKPEGMRYDYYLVKTPRVAPPAMTRADFIAMMTKELALPVYQDGKAPLEGVEDGLSKTLGTRVDLSGAIKPRGADDVCVYLGGEVQVTSALASYPIAVGGCGTIVGGKLIYVYSYDDSAKPGSVAAQIRRTRALAETLRSTDLSNLPRVNQP